jgi:hypothetical protein
MNLKVNLKQFELPVFSSLRVPSLRKNLLKLQVATESFTRGEIDFLWLYVFTRSQPSLQKIKVLKQRRSKRQRILTLTSFHKSYLIYYTFRKLKWLEIYLKDPDEILRNPITETGQQGIRLINCEQNIETRKFTNLSSGLDFFLEDIIIFSNFFYKEDPALLGFMIKLYT